MENPSLFLIESLLALLITLAVAVWSALQRDGITVLYAAGLMLLVEGEFMVGGMRHDGAEPEGLIIFSGFLIGLGFFIVVFAQPQNNKTLGLRQVLAFVVGLALILLTLRAEYLRLLDGTLTITRAVIYAINIAISIYILLSALRLSSSVYEESYG